jgi:galactoside 2-L-fucosyltransferase 1/2
MFQYAALYSVLRRYRYNWTPRLGKKFRDLADIFNLSIPIMRGTRHRNVLLISEQRGDVLETLKILRSLPPRNVSLLGYYQSYKYFEDVKFELRREFIFKERLTNAVDLFLDKFAPKEICIRVGVHVRRTDITNPENTDRGYLQPPLSYYQHAMDFFRIKYARVRFFVASDDMTWCRARLPGSDIYFSENSVEFDLTLLSMCNHVITSVGTFSWWAGWLCTGTTLYYGVDPPRDSKVQRVSPRLHYYPINDEYNNWIPIV